MTGPAVAEKTRVLTKYRVLKFPTPSTQTITSGAAGSSVTASAGQGYTDVGRVAAINAGAAIRELGEKNGQGTYVAIPESSWKPQTVTIETQTVVKLSP